VEGVLLLHVKRYNKLGKFAYGGIRHPMNVPNMITICRFVLIPIYIIVFANGYTISAFLIVLLAGLTDVLDGYIARTKGLITPLGEMLDPLADKSMMIVVILSLLISGLIPWYAAVAFFIRDAGMIIGSAIFHFRGKKTVPANTMGKITTVLYYIAILLIVFKIDYAIHYLWFVIAFSFITSAIYIGKFRSLNSNNSL
jgi:cardiolipin synthase